MEDPCKCEARLAFQKQTQAAVQQLTAKHILCVVSGGRRFIASGSFYLLVLLEYDSTVCGVYFLKGATWSPFLIRPPYEVCLQSSFLD